MKKMLFPLLLVAVLLFGGCGKQEPAQSLVQQEDKLVVKSSAASEQEPEGAAESQSSAPAVMSVDEKYADLNIDEVTPQMYSLIMPHLENAAEVELGVAAQEETEIGGESCYTYKAVDNKPDKAQTLGFFAVNKSVTKLYKLDEETKEYKLLAEVEAK